jgi:hypothetical protein
MFEVSTFDSAEAWTTAREDERLPLQRAKEQNTMPKLVIALAIAVVGARPVVASQETDVMAPVRQFVDGFNKSDIKMAQAACADQYPRFDS